MNIRKLLLFAAVIIITAPASKVSAYDFPSCSSYLGKIGNVAHYTSGLHQIIGGSLMQGQDDVYGLSNNNYLQCFCPDNGGPGIQTNWLRSDTHIDGWFFVNGRQWGLGNYQYAAQNSSFNCHPQPLTPASGGGSPPVCDSKQPLPPTNFMVTRSGSSANLKWTESADTTHYSILYGLKPDEYTFGVVNTGKTDHITVDHLDPGQNYYFAIKSVNNCMPSELTTPGSVLGLSTVAGLASTGYDSTPSLFLFLVLLMIIAFAVIQRRIIIGEAYEIFNIFFRTAQNLAIAAYRPIRGELKPGDTLFVGTILQSQPTRTRPGSSTNSHS